MNYSLVGMGIAWAIGVIVEIVTVVRYLRLRRDAGLLCLNQPPRRSAKSELEAL